MKTKPTKRVFYISVFLLISFFLFGYLNWQWPVTKPADQRLQVTTSFYPLYYFASQVGGDKVSVSNITPAGAEPHDYEPTPQDIIQITNSQILFLNGGVEPWGQKMKNNLQGKNTKLVEVGSNLMTETILDEGKDTLDPHVWLSPVLAKQIVAKITEELVSVDQINQEYYLENSKNLQMKLDQLDKNFRLGLKTCQTKDIITSHAAFGYLANAYGLKQIALAGLSPDAEPSLQDLAKVSTFARAHKIKYIFFESLVSPKLSDTIAREVGAQTLVLNPLEGLTAKDQQTGKDYFTEMTTNLQNLRIALSCQ